MYGLYAYIIIRCTSACSKPDRKELLTQSVERRHVNPEVAVSNPTFFFVHPKFKKRRICVVFQLKLADVLNKYIVPVSFVEKWPPCCLAIQFATTQFINWRQGKQNRGQRPLLMMFISF